MSAATVLKCGYRRLVAPILSYDLFVCAKDLFVDCHGTEKAPTTNGRGKLAKRDRRLFGPSCSAPTEERLSGRTSLSRSAHVLGYVHLREKFAR